MSPVGDLEDELGQDRLPEGRVVLGNHDKRSRPADDLLRIVAIEIHLDRRRPGPGLRAIVEEGLRMALRKPASKTRKKRVHLITVKGGLPPDIDLSDREAMYRWLDESRQAE